MDPPLNTPILALAPSRFYWRDSWVCAHLVGQGACK